MDGLWLTSKSLCQSIILLSFFSVSTIIVSPSTPKGPYSSAESFSLWSHYAMMYENYWWHNSSVGANHGVAQNLDMCDIETRVLQNTHEHWEKAFQINTRHLRPSTSTLNIAHTQTFLHLPKLKQDESNFLKLLCFNPHVKQGCPDTLHLVLFILSICWWLNQKQCS